MCFCLFFFFFFKQKTAYELRISDWSSDVCSSDLQFVKGADTGLALGLPRLRGLANPFQFLVNGLLTARFLALFLRHALGLRLQPRAVIRSEEHTSELQSLMRISYAVFCLKKKTNINHTQNTSITSLLRLHTESRHSYT